MDKGYRFWVLLYFSQKAFKLWKQKCFLKPYLYHKHTSKQFNNNGTVTINTVLYILIEERTNCDKLPVASPRVLKYTYGNNQESYCT